MRFLASFTLFAFCLSVQVGCSRGKGELGEKPPSAPAPEDKKPKTPDRKTPEPEPEPEPAPGELVNLKLPKDGGAWPWNVGRSGEPSLSTPIQFKGSGPYTANGFAVRPEINRVVVSARVDPFGKKGVDPRKVADSTRFSLYDTASGQTISEWVVPGLHSAIDLSPDGRSLLVTSPQPGKERCTLRLWVVGSDNQLKRWHVIAHTPPGEGLRTDSSITGGTEIRWAAFVGERVVSVSRAGQVRVFDSEQLRPIATIDASPCRPAITPDGTRVAFLFGPSIAVLDPTARKITGTRWIGIAPPHPVLAFNPDGDKLAVGGNGRAVLLNLNSGQHQNIHLPRLDVNDNGVFDRPFGWAGSSHLLTDSLLFDPQLPQPVWEYSTIELIQFRGGRVWTYARAPGSQTVTLQAHALPAAAVESAAAAAKARPGALGLQPGSGVKIDVNGLPEDRRAETRETLEKRLREVGFKPDANGAATLFASVDSPGTRPSVIYSSYAPYSYTKKPARLRLVLGDKELWSDAWAVEPPFVLDLPKESKDSVVADHLGNLGLGQPDYRAFSLAPIPSHLPGPNAPTAPLGKTDLAAPGK